MWLLMHYCIGFETTDVVIDLLSYCGYSHLFVIFLAHYPHAFICWDLRAICAPIWRELCGGKANYYVADYAPVREDFRFHA